MNAQIPISKLQKDSKQSKTLAKTFPQSNDSAIFLKNESAQLTLTNFGACMDIPDFPFSSLLGKLKKR